ncbi:MULTISPECIES: EF-hand domain-containing protein [unclassified Bradyrhizobium]|uniref:EF-hand domain-containing protein n=1 Tax=unclassified Bradyrhizobium TaxID=2631580 RepID=UPI0028E40AE1|nr:MULTISPECIES: EF-hand domain-containing protein [unclassified Bradyrhizobium]
MWFALGAASSILEGLQSLGSSRSGASQSNGSGSGLFDFLGGSGSTNSSANFTPWQPSTSGGSAQISSETMSALIAAQSQSGTSASSGSTSFKDPLQDLFSQLDGNGNGQISKSEFESALGAGGTNVANADSVFGKLDSNGDGNVSFDELKSALKGGHSGRHNQAASANDGSGSNGMNASSDALMQALSGASSSSSNNSDGSTTTTITYADGSKVTMTSPAASASASSASSSYNLIEKLIQRESNALSNSASSASAVSA